MKTLVFVGLVAFANVVLAAELPEFMTGNWVQASRDNEMDKISITRSFDFNAKYKYGITVDQSRQVGSNDTPDIPYETECRYRYTGTVTEFGSPSDDTRNQYQSSGKNAPTYSVSYAVSKVELLPALFNSPNCRKFIEKENQLAADNNLNFTWNFSDLADDVLEDPWYGTIFVKRGL